MSLLAIRGTVAFPSGENDTDTAIGGSHLNLTTLQDFGYRLFENGTLSNDTKCVLAFEPYTPAYVYPNGTFVDSTTCYISLDPIGVRAKTGVALGALYAVALIFIIINLRKHGALYLPKVKRFFPISRRWQWYWGLMVCTFALIGLFTNVDVDRYYVMEIPIILTSFFWFLMQQAAIALVWEAVRHWGSWCERQLVDAEPHAMRDDDLRSKFELLVPVWFYLWIWLNFFLVIPRKWGKIQLQRTPEQTLLNAKPSATDARFKAGAFCLLVAWLTIIASLIHTVKHYQTRRRGLVGKVVDFHRSVPLRFYFIIPLALVIVAYQALVAFQWDYSPLKVDGNVVAIYVGGYVPTLLILVVQILYGHFAPNEDEELIRQRRLRGEEINRELGIVPKPTWWDRIKHGAKPTNMQDVITRNVNEVRGERKPTTGQGVPSVTTGDTANIDVELSEASTGSARAIQGLCSARPAATGAPLEVMGPPPPYDESAARQVVSRNVSGSAATSISNQQPQHVRSMLDV